MQQIAILMGCAILPHLKSLVEIIEHGKYLFPDRYNLDVFKWRVKRFLLSKRAPLQIASLVTNTLDGGETQSYSQIKNLTNP